MIDLPNGPKTATTRLLDNGVIQKTAFGGAANRVHRQGTHYKISVSAGPFYQDDARGWVADLIAAKMGGARMDYPLENAQPPSGAPVVDGAGQAGTTLVLRGVDNAFECKKGFWLSIEDATGRHYLHNIRSEATVTGGSLTVQISPELRAPFLDGATVNLTTPKIEGLIDGDEWSWDLTGAQVTPIRFTIEEVK